MKTENNHICAFCKYYEEPFGFYDQMCRCAKTRRPIQETSTCQHFVHSGQLDMFTDINDEIDSIENDAEFV